MKRWLVTRREGRFTYFWTGEMTGMGFPVTTLAPICARQFDSAADAYEAAGRVSVMADSDMWRVTAWEPI